MAAEMGTAVPETEATSSPVFISGAILSGNVSTRRTAVPEVEDPSVTRSANFEDEPPPS